MVGVGEDFGSFVASSGKKPKSVEVSANMVLFMDQYMHLQMKVFFS